MAVLYNFNILVSIAKYFSISSIIFLDPVSEKMKDLTELSKKLNKEDFYVQFSKKFLVSSSASVQMVVSLSPDENFWNYLRQVIETKSSYLRSIVWVIETKEFPHDIDIPLDCQFLLMKKVNLELELFEVYTVNRTKIMRKFGTLSSHRELQFRTYRGAQIRRSQLYGTVLYTAHDLMLKGDCTATQDYSLNNRGCIYYHAWTSLQHRLNFSSKLVNSNDADVILHPLTAIREQFLGQFIAPVNTVGYHIVFRKVADNEFDVWIFMKPFTMKLWFGILCWTFMITILAQCISNKWSHSDQIGNGSKSAWFDFMAVYCKQPVIVSIHSSVRLIYSMILIMSLILSVAYSANLISYITISKNLMPFTYLEGLVDHPSYKLAMRSDVGVETWRNYTNPTLHKIYTNQVYKATSGVAEICKGHKITLGLNNEEMIDWHRHGTCAINEKVIGPYTRYQYTWLFQFNSPYRFIFSYYSLVLQESGSLSGYRRMKYLQDEVKVLEEEPEALDISAVSSLFLCVLLGVLTSIVVFTVEVNVDKIKRWFATRAKSKQVFVGKKFDKFELVYLKSPYWRRRRLKS